MPDGTLVSRRKPVVARFSGDLKNGLIRCKNKKTGVTLGYKTTLPGIGTFFADTCKRFQRPTETILKEQECET
jgi:hypothetical protein